MTSTMSSEEELVDEDDYEVGGSGGSCAVTAAISVHAATNVIAPPFRPLMKKNRGIHSVSAPHGVRIHRTLDGNAG